MRIISRQARNNYLCDDNKIYTIKELAYESGLTVSGLQHRIRAFGVHSPKVLDNPTLGMVFGKVAPKTFVESKIINSRVYYKDDSGKWYTAKMVFNFYGINEEKFRQRMIKEPFPVDVVRVCSKKRIQSGVSMERSEADGWVNGFKRSDYCQRETGECRRYNQCLDAMCINPAWKKPGYECYDAPRRQGNNYKAIQYSL